MSCENKYMTFKTRYADPEYKVRFNLKYNQKITCDCGCVITGLNYKRHLLSKKHITFINILNSVKKSNNI